MALETAVQLLMWAALQEACILRGAQAPALQHKHLQILYSLLTSFARSSSCGICCEDYTSGEVLRRLRCGHKYHLECIDRWFLSSLDYSRPVACPICNAPLSKAVS